MKSLIHTLYIWGEVVVAVGCAIALVATLAVHGQIYLVLLIGGTVVALFLLVPMIRRISIVEELTKFGVSYENDPTARSGDPHFRKRYEKYLREFDDAEVHYAIAVSTRWYPPFAKKFWFERKIFYSFICGEMKKMNDGLPLEVAATHKTPDVGTDQT